MTDCPTPCAPCGSAGDCWKEPGMESSLTVYENLVQRSPEWFEARCGIVTASTVNALVTTAAPDALAVECPRCKAAIGSACVNLARKDRAEVKKPHDERTEKASALPPVYVPATGDTARSLIATLVAERITKAVEETYVTRDMERGIISESYARDLYSQHCTDKPVIEVGFMARNYENFTIGYSPDGLVGDDGLIEIKSPRRKGHVLSASEQTVPAYYMAQIQTGLLVSGREWCDFVSFAGLMRLWIKRIYPDPAYQSAILAAVEQAETAIQQRVDAFHEATEGLPIAPAIDLEVVI